MHMDTYMENEVQHQPDLRSAASSRDLQKHASAVVVEAGSRQVERGYGRLQAT